MERTMFGKSLDEAIREAEKLVRRLRQIRDLTDAEERLAGAVTAAKISEGVTLRVRRLPAHTGHPKGAVMAREAIRESVPVELGFTEQGWFCLRLPMLLPRKEKSSRSYIRGFLYPALEEFAADLEPVRYRNCVLIFRHVYDYRRSEREYRDHDNIELNAVVDAVAMYFLVDDTPLECRHYYCSASGTIERTEVYLVPRAEYQAWLELEDSIPDIGLQLLPKLPQKAEKDAKIRTV